MATTMYFEETLTDKEDKSRKLEVEFGRSSFYGENLAYLTVGGQSVILDRATGQRFFHQMWSLGNYLGYYDK